MKECLKKRGLDVMQARRMVGVCEGCSLDEEPLTLKRCHSYMKPLKGGSPSVAEPTT